jgi:alkylation response protein AidB-like acyl-CoA dehydrogenase
VARSLAPLVEAEVAQGAEDTIITSKVVEAWKDAGLQGVLMPTHLGGGGVDNVTYLHIAEELTRQDGSAGWVYGCHQVATVMCGIFVSEDALRELIGSNADGLACGAGSITGEPCGTAKRVEGGYLVETPALRFGSGSQYATRAVALVALVDDNDERMIGDDGNPIKVYMWVDPSNVEWLNDWNAAGLAGSGSGSYMVKRHVLDEKWMGTDNEKKRADGTIFNQGFTPRSRAAPISDLFHSGVALGLAKRAIEEVVRSTRGRRRGDVPALDEHPLFQSEFVRIESEYQATRAFVLNAFQELWDATIEGRLTDLHHARTAQATLHLHRVLNDIVTTASLWAGSDVIPKDGIYARLNADARVAMNHLLMGPQYSVTVAPQVLAAWRADD